MSNLDFLGNPSLLEMVAETTDPAAWLAMVLLKDMSHNLPKTQGEATDRIKALCNHAIAMARKAPPGCVIDEQGVVRPDPMRLKLADGAYAKPGDYYFTADGGGHVSECVLRFEWYGTTTSSRPDRVYSPQLGYSTCEAAEAAKEGA